MRTACLVTDLFNREQGHRSVVEGVPDSQSRGAWKWVGFSHPKTTTSNHAAELFGIRAERPANAVKDLVHSLDA